jgi:hypothetical protein
MSTDLLRDDRVGREGDKRVPVNPRHLEEQKCVALNMAGMVRCGRQPILAERFRGGFDRLMQRSDDRPAPANLAAIDFPLVFVLPRAGDPRASQIERT